MIMAEFRSVHSWGLKSSIGSGERVRASRRTSIWREKGEASGLTDVYSGLLTL